MTDTKQGELKPCPFCGGMPIEDRIEPHKHSLSWMPDYPGSWSVECPKCEFRLFDHDSRENVIAAWNRRSPSTAQAGEAIAWHCVNNVNGKMLYTDSIDAANEMREQKHGHCTVTALYTAPPVREIGEALALLHDIKQFDISQFTSKGGFTLPQDLRERIEVVLAAARSQS